MRKLAIRSLWPALAATVLWVAISVQHATPALGQNASVQVVEVTARKYEYSPAPIHVKNGTKIHLKITATDHDHGFSIATVRRRRLERSRGVGIHVATGMLATQKRRNDDDRISAANFRHVLIQMLPHLWPRPSRYEESARRRAVGCSDFPFSKLDKECSTTASPSGAQCPQTAGPNEENRSPAAAGRPD